MIESSWNDAFPFRILVITHHREGFAGSGLSIGEDGAVKTLQSVLDERISACLIYTCLLGINSIDIVEDELFSIITFFYAYDVISSFHTQGRIKLGLSFVQGTNSQSHFHRFVFSCTHKVINKMMDNKLTIYLTPTK